MLHFFANGGSQAFVTRVPVENADPARSVLAGDGTGATALTLTALGSGAAGGSIFVEVDSFDIDADPFGTAPDKKRFNLTVLDSLTGRTERFGNLTTASGNARTADAVVNDPTTGSKLVRLTMTPRDQAGPRRPARSTSSVRSPRRSQLISSSRSRCRAGPLTGRRLSPVVQRRRGHGLRERGKGPDHALES